MEVLLIKIINMSISASWVALALIVFRFVFKNIPRWMTVALWGMVAVRLILPFSVKSIFSVVPSVKTIPEDILITNSLYINNDLHTYLSIGTVVWISGIFIMSTCAIWSYIRLRCQISESVCMEGNIRLVDKISTPFVLGIVKPKIYLPSSMKQDDMQYVIAHEQAHIKRKDYIWKPLGFLLLTIYWFQPMIWVAYVLLCHDIEIACDEKVMREYGSDIKKIYANVLLNCSVSRKMIIACPLAFGEVAVKSRIQKVMNYQKTPLWIVCSSLIVCLGLGACLLTDPIEKILTLEDCQEMKSEQLLNNILNYASIEEIFTYEKVFNISGGNMGQTPTKNVGIEDLMNTYIPLKEFVERPEAEAMLQTYLYENESNKNSFKYDVANELYKWLTNKP